MTSPPYCNDREVIFTFLKIGNSMKVTAVDTQTGIEVTIQTPPSLPITVMKAAVVQKLSYVINKKAK